jgi:hypothetical protein
VAEVWSFENLDWHLKCRDLRLIGSAAFTYCGAMLEEILKRLNRMVSEQLNKRNG